jgi:hypothetical protein
LRSWWWQAFVDLWREPLAPTPTPKSTLVRKIS